MGMLKDLRNADLIKLGVFNVVEKGCIHPTL